MPALTLFRAPSRSTAATPSAVSSRSTVAAGSAGKAVGSAGKKAPGATANATHLRLTRRGRLVFIGLPLMLTAAAALTVLGFFTAPAKASSGAPEVTETLKVSVTPGDSLWGLAEEFAPDRDPRDVVSDIMELNNLSDDRVSAGVQLYIPVQP